MVLDFMHMTGAVVWAVLAVVVICALIYSVIYWLLLHLGGQAVKRYAKTLSASEVRNIANDLYSLYEIKRRNENGH